MKDNTRNQSLKSDKCETCESLRNEVTSLHGTLEIFTKGKDI